MLITTCLHCKTQFRITEKHLALADGLVMCSHCHKAFQAKDSLKEVDDNTTVILKKNKNHHEQTTKTVPRLNDQDSVVSTTQKTIQQTSAPSPKVEAEKKSPPTKPVNKNQPIKPTTNTPPNIQKKPQEPAVEKSRVKKAKKDQPVTKKAPPKTAEKKPKKPFWQKWLDSTQKNAASKKKSAPAKRPLPTAKPTPQTQKPAEETKPTQNIQPVAQSLKIQTPPPAAPPKDTDPRKNIGIIGRQPPRSTPVKKSSWLDKLWKKSPAAAKEEKRLPENQAVSSPTAEATIAPQTAKPAIPETKPAAQQTKPATPKMATKPLGTATEPENHFAPVNEPATRKPIPIAPLHQDYATPPMRADLPPHPHRDFFENRQPYVPPPPSADEETNWTIATLIALIVLIMQMFYIILQK